jgi:hypothetical protein
MRGILIFAFNIPQVDYFKIAEWTAKRAEHYLHLPVTVVTNKQSLPKDHYQFDHCIVVENESNSNSTAPQWINKGRHLAYDLSPYDETLVLDVDYVINSDQLLKICDFGTDFCCHDTAEFLLQPSSKTERLSRWSHDTLWATVMYFKKARRAKQIFDAMSMIEKNYHHYANLHHFAGGQFRNDYALTLALHLINGHVWDNRDFIPWKLLHVDKHVRVNARSEIESSEFKLYMQTERRGKSRLEYITVSDTDFHMMNKRNLLEIIG